MKKYKIILSVFLIAFICAFSFACSKDDEEPTKEPVIEPSQGELTPEPTVNEEELLEAEKDAAKDEIKTFVEALNKDEYTTENWTKIENQLFDYSAKILEATSISDVKKLVENFQFLIGLVPKKPIDSNNDGIAVTDEVWGYIESSITNALTVKDFRVEYDASFPTLGQDAGSYLQDLDIVLKGIVNNTEGEYYAEFDNKSDLKFKVWIKHESDSIARVAYIDIESEELTGKYVLKAEELVAYLLEDYFGITIDPDTSIPGVSEDITITDILDILNPDNNNDSSIVDSDTVKGYVSEVLRLLKDNSETKMWVSSTETKVTAYLSKDTFIEQYPELEEVLTTDINVEIYLNSSNKVTKIALIPIVEEIELPDDPADIENSTINLSIIDKIQFLFADDKLTSGYIWVKVLNNNAAIGLRLSYDNLELPVVNKDEYEHLDIDALIKENEFKTHAKKIAELYSLYVVVSLNPTNELSFEEFVGQNVDSDFIMYLLNNNNMKLYKTALESATDYLSFNIYVQTNILVKTWILYYQLELN